MDVLEILCCPECKGDLTVACRQVTPSRMKSAVLFCAACNDVVAVGRNFKFDFRHFDRGAARSKLKRHGFTPEPCVVLPYEVGDVGISFDDPLLRRNGAWMDWDGKYALNHGVSGDEIVFCGDFLDIGVRLLNHPWSGVVALVLDGRVVKEVDLYQPKWATIHWYSVANDLPPGPHTLKVVVTGRSNPEALGQQVLLHEIVITTAGGGPAASPTTDVNRVLPIFPSVIDLINRAPADGRILDCGGGDRVLGDPRYVNLEYLEYQLPAVYGNALKMPFKNDSFDLVFSQAVLEHVPNPFIAVEEMRRVTKPGGIVWAGMAFMQPVHAVPFHYFNATSWGIEELFRGLQIEDLTWFGELSFTVDWLFQSAGIPEKIGMDAYNELMAKIKALDQLISHEELKAVASGVGVQARKV